MKLEKFKEENKKKKGILLFTISCVLLIVGVFFYQSFALFEARESFNFIEGQVQDPGDLYFAYYVDDVITYDMPSKESGYILTSKSNCTNGVTVDWDIYHWRALVNYDNYKKENNSRVKCNLYFKNASFAEAVSSCGKGGGSASVCMEKYKSLDTINLQHDGTTENNLRYIGTNPNNYVSFNNELWRIIGVMNSIDNGFGVKESRIKLIRNASIGEYSWDTSDSTVNGGDGVNEWSQADLMKLLNPGYDNESVGGSLYWNRTNGNCYNGYKNATTSCDFTNIGLTTEAKSLITQAVWYTGTKTTDHDYGLTTKDYYDFERSNNTGKMCSGTYCNDTVPRTARWTGNIGLILPSDFGFATVGGSTKDRTTCLNFELYGWGMYSEVTEEEVEEFPYVECITNNWVSAFMYQKTMMPNNKSAVKAMWLPEDYGASAGDVSQADRINPVLFLDKSVRIVSGDGTKELPYSLSK